jgi:hypothetical protein
MHKVGETNRHKQLANVERLNKELGRLFNGFMNAKEEQTGKIYKEWTDVLSTVRTELNAFRKKAVGDPATDVYKVPPVVKAKYKVGDLVYHILEQPENALGQKQPTTNFRMGDYRWNRVPTKIVKVLFYPEPVPVRYVLNGKPNVSYAEYELKPAVEDVEKFVVKQIIDKKVEKGKVYYKVWWKKYLKKDATWEKREELIKDIKDLVLEFDKVKK